MIYMDYASTTPVSPEIITVIKKDLEQHWGNPSNLYSISEEPKKIINEARSVIARCIGADMDEIFFTSGASEGNAWVCQQGSKILCSQYEHHNLTRNPKCVIIDEQYLANCVYNKSMSSIIPQAIELDYSGMVCSWMYVNNETGEIFNIEKFCESAHQLGMLFHSDMTQALGNVPINVHDLHVDLATFTGHKVHAPKGIGFIYIKKDVWQNTKNRPFVRMIPGGGQEMSFRAGTENVPYIDALRMAVHSATVNRTAKHNHCFILKKLMVEELNKNGVPFIINSPGNSVTNILNISIKDVSGENLMMDLSDRGIFVGTGSGCNSGSGEPSEVLQAMGIADEYIHGAIRFSFDFATTKDDVKSVAKNIGELVKSYME